jgi:hypothetical protein
VTIPTTRAIGQHTVLRIPAGRRSHASWAAVPLVLLVLLGRPPRADAQQLNLAISPVTVTFPTTADPDTTPVLTSVPVTVQYRVRANGNRPWVLTVHASGDLASGASTIPASAVSWTAAPSPPLATGALSATQAQAVASGAGNVNPSQTGTLTFRLTNSWNYDAGTYMQTLTFTLSTP